MAGTDFIIFQELRYLDRYCASDISRRQWVMFSTSNRPVGELMIFESFSRNLCAFLLSKNRIIATQAKRCILKFWSLAVSISPVRFAFKDLRILVLLCPSTGFLFDLCYRFYTIILVGIEVDSSDLPLIGQGSSSNCRYCASFQWYVRLLHFGLLVKPCKAMAPQKGVNL